MIVGAKDWGSSTEMDDSIIRDFVNQVSRVINPKKEYAVRAPDATPGLPTRAPDVEAPGPTRAGDAGGDAVSGGGQRAPADTAVGGQRAPADAPGGQRADATTNADGTPAPKNAGEVKQQLELKSTRSKEESTDHSPEGKKKQIDDAEQQKNDWLSKVGGLGGLAMVGLTLAVATAIAVKTGKEFTSCVNAELTIKKVAPTPRTPSWVPDWEWIVKLFPVPKTVDITYSANNDYKPLAKSDTWDISGTNVIDKKAVMIEKVLEGKVVRVKCGADDCSKVKSTSGTAQVNCDFSDRLNEAVKETADDIGSVMSRFMQTAGSVFMSFLPIIILCVVLFIGFSLFAK